VAIPPAANLPPAIAPVLYFERQFVRQTIGLAKPVISSTGISINWRIRGSLSSCGEQLQQHFPSSLTLGTDHGSAFAMRAGLAQLRAPQTKGMEISLVNVTLFISRSQYFAFIYIVNPQASINCASTKWPIRAFAITGSLQPS